MPSIKKNIFYQTLYQILNIIIPLVTVPIVTRALGPVELGKFSYTTAIVNYFALFALLGLRKYGTREIARTNSKKDKKLLSDSFFNIYTMQLLLSCIVIIIYSLYILLFVKENKVLSIIQVIILLVTATDISWFFFGIEEFKVTVTRNIFVKLLSAILIIFFIKTPKDIFLYTFFIGGSQLISNLFLLFNLRSHVIIIRPSISKMLYHFKNNLVLFIPVVAASFYIYIDKIMIGNIAHDYDVGYYEAMEKIINIPNALITSITMVMFPRMSSLIKEDKNNANIQNYVKKSLFFVLFFTIGCVFGLLSISDIFVPLFFGGEYLPVVDILCIGGIILIPRGIREVIKSEILLPNGKEKQVTIAVIIGASIDFILNFILIPRYASKGAIIATLICEISSTITVILFCKAKWLSRSLINIISFSVIGFTMFLFLQKIKVKYFMDGNWLNIIILIIIGVVIYVVLSTIYYIFITRLNKNLIKKI